MRLQQVITAHVNESVLLQLVQNSPIGMSLTASDGVITFWNRAMEAITGFTEAETLGALIWDIQYAMAAKEQKTPDHYSYLKTRALNMLHGAVRTTPARSEYAIRRGDGEERLVEESVFTITTECGTQLASIIRDVTVENAAFHKQAEQVIQQASMQLDALHKDVLGQNAQLEQIVEERTAELRHLHDRMATILNNTSDAIILLDPEHRVQNVNLSFDQLFGYDRDEAFGFPIQNLADAASAQTLLKAVKTALETRERQRIQIVALGKNGQTFDADVALAPMRRDSGHIICSIRDITHFKELDRVKDEFLSMVSHELRTPVTAIVLSADAVIRYHARMTDEQKMHKLHQIRQQAENLTELVNSILDISRFNARTQQHIYTKVEVHNPLNDVVAELLPQAETRHQQIQVTVDSNPAIITADAADICRIWRNLISNAIKYTGEGSTIRVSLHTPSTSGRLETLPDLTAFSDHLPTDLIDGGYIVGLVTDNGPGIREQDMAQLFTRFFRGWAAGTSIPGTGLGLSLVKEILHLYQGDISVSSAQNMGTTFCFWLPIEKRSIA